MEKTIDKVNFSELCIDKLLKYIKSSIRREARGTPERNIIFQNMLQQEDYFSASDIYVSVNGCSSKEVICQASIYNTFALFEKIGIIKRIPNLDKTALYELEYKSLFRIILFDNE